MAQTIKQQVAAMTREQLEAEAVEVLVAKWGEAERGGCVRQARQMGLTRLRAEAVERRGGVGNWGPARAVRHDD